MIIIIDCGSSKVDFEMIQRGGDNTCLYTDPISTEILKFIAVEALYYETINVRYTLVQRRITLGSIKKRTKEKLMLVTCINSRLGEAQAN